MNRYLHFKPILFCLFAALTIKSKAQQEYTLTTSAANVSSAKALIDLPGLSGNTDAIIIATPLGNTKTINPHPTGAWYYSGKWNIFNCDFAPMPVGLSYKVQYFLTAGINQFLHLVTQGNLGAEGSYIDNPVLNNKPNAQFSIFPNHSPDVRAGSWLNPNEAKAAYNASNGKWYITNINGQPMQKGCAYNIVMSSPSGTTSTGPVNNPPAGSCNCPVSLPPNGSASGDLGGTYPNPSVQRLSGNPLSPAAPQIGQVLRWNGTEWEPAQVNTGITPTDVTNSKPYVFYYNLTDWAKMDNPAVNSVSLPGLNNQTFTLSKSSRVVFYTVVYVQYVDANLITKTNPVWITVDILNASNTMVASATGEIELISNSKNASKSINATGIGILPAGTYHTRVMVDRPMGAPYLQILQGGNNGGAYDSRHPIQGGQMIVQVFPD